VQTVAPLSGNLRDLARDFRW